MLVSHGDIAVGYLGGGQVPKKASSFGIQIVREVIHLAWNHWFAERYLGVGFRYLLFLCLFWEIIQFDKICFKGVETIWIIWHWHFHHCAPKNCLRNSFRHLIAQTGDWHFLSWNGLTRPEGEPARIIGHNGSGVSKWRRKNSNQKTTSWKTKWWFQTFFIFTPTWVNDAIWLRVIFFRWVETTN